jgi:3,4-dihydroxy 2-butanone 4-phosphate synthase/GTP cyclohydrolase II
MSNNPDKIKALEDNGIEVAARVPHLMRPNQHNIGYLTAKRDRMGHDLPQVDVFAAD